MASSEDGVYFHEMGLDDRLLKAIAKLGWSKPTLIQEKAIPLALEGKDILARAKTGSGKTAAYAIPVVQKILQLKSMSVVPSATTAAATVKALVLVPSKELSQQATKNIKELSSCCFREVKSVDISNSPSAHTKRALQDKPDIVVGTPSRVLTHLQNKSLQLKDSLELLVVDEADLVFSYGYEDDIKAILGCLPSIYQAFLMSATLSEDVLSLRKMVLHNPVTLKLEEADLPEEVQLTQYHIKCSSEDKFLLIYTLLKLKLISGKTLLFVNTIDRCYKLKLFLEQFSIKSCVLNSELPHNSRCHVVDEFNRGMYDYIIATDEAHTLGRVGGANGSSHGNQKRSRKRKRDKEYGVARGIDFQGVENVINFDFPPTPDDYVHRVGRTARGFECGAALTFVCPTDEDRLAQVEERLRGDGGTNDDAAAVVVKPYQFRMTEIEGFRYRVTDALRAVTKGSIKEARLKEIRSEILNSERLKSHFDDNPRDLQVLRHDVVLQPNRVQPHLKHIPSYLVPKALQAPAAVASTPPSSATDRFPPSKRGRYSGEKRGKGFKPAKTRGKRRNDPLKTFSFSK